MRDIEPGVVFKNCLYGCLVMIGASGLLLFFCPAWQPQLLSFSVGMSLGILNGWLLRNSIQALTALVIHGSVEVGQVLQVVGMGIRWVLLFGVFFYLCWTGYCPFFGLLAGYFAFTLLMTASTIYHLSNIKVDAGGSENIPGGDDKDKKTLAIEEC